MKVNGTAVKVFINLGIFWDDTANQKDVTDIPGLLPLLYRRNERI